MEKARPPRNLERRAARHGAKHATPSAPRPTSTIESWTASLAADAGQLDALDAAVGAVHTHTAPLQLQQRTPAPRTASAQAIAARAVGGQGRPLPHQARIQAAFGRHDVSDVRAFVGGAAASASRDLGASGFAMGDAVAFAGDPDLRLAAHEAAHVVQQRAGVSLMGGVGARGDVYERHADEVAELVASGRSAEGVLDRLATGGGDGTRALQKQERPGGQAAATGQEGTTAPPRQEVQASPEDIAAGLQQGVLTFGIVRWIVSWPADLAGRLGVEGRKNVALTVAARNLFTGGAAIDDVARAATQGLSSGAMTHIGGAGAERVEILYGPLDYLRRNLGADWSTARAQEIAAARAAQAYDNAIEYALTHWADIVEAHGMLRSDEPAEELQRVLRLNRMAAALLMSRGAARNIRNAITAAAPELPTAVHFAAINRTLFAVDIVAIVRALRGALADQARRQQQDAPDLAPDGLPHPFPMALLGSARAMISGVATYTADVRPTDVQFNPRGGSENLGRRVLEEARTIQRATYRWELVDLNDLQRSTEGAMQAGRRGLAAGRQGREIGGMDGVLRQAGNELRNWSTDFSNSWQAAGNDNLERAQAVLRMFGPMPQVPVTRRQAEQQTHALNLLLGTLTLAGTAVRQGLRLAWHAVVDDANESTVPTPPTPGLYGVRCIMTPRRLDGTPSRHPSIAAKVVQIFSREELAHQSMSPLEAQIEELLQRERDPARRRVLEQTLERLRSTPETPAVDMLQRQLDELRAAQRQMTPNGADWTRAQERIVALERQLGLARTQRAEVAAGGRTVVTPLAAHVDAESGQMTRMRIQMSVGRASALSPWEARVSDVTVAAMSEVQTGTGATVEAAIDQAFDRVRHGNVYPRGLIRVRFPRELVDLGLPAARHESSYECEPLGTPLLRANLQRLAEDVGYLAFIGVPGAGQAAMIVGATSALANMSARARAGRLHFDNETASDLMNILPIITSRIPMPGLNGRFRVLRQGGRFVIQGVRLAGELGPAIYPIVSIPLHLGAQIREIEDAIARGELDPGIGRDRINALIATQGANMLMAVHGLASHAAGALEPGVLDVPIEPEPGQTGTPNPPNPNEPQPGQTGTRNPNEPQPGQTGTRNPNEPQPGQTGGGGARPPVGAGPREPVATTPPRQPGTNPPREPAQGNGPREGQPREGQPREPTPAEQAAVPRTQGVEPPAFGAPVEQVRAFIERANSRDILQWWWSLGDWATRMRVEAQRLPRDLQERVNAARMELYREAEARAGVRGSLSGSTGLGSDVDPTFAGPRTHEDVRAYNEAMEAAIRARGLDPTGWREILGLNPYSDPQLERFQINDRVNGQLTPEAQAARSRLLSREAEIVELNHRNRLMHEDPDGGLWREFVQGEVQRMVDEHPGDAEPAARLQAFFDAVNARAQRYDQDLVAAALRVRPALATEHPNTLAWLHSPEGFLTMREARARMLGDAQAALQARIQEGAARAGAGANPDAAGANMSITDREAIQGATQEVKALEEEAYQPSAIDSVVVDQQRGHQGRLEAGEQPLAMRDMAPEARMNALIDSVNMLEEHVHQVEAMLRSVQERSAGMSRAQLESAVRDALKPLAKYLARALFEARELGMPLSGRFRLLSDLSRMLRARQGEQLGGGATARNPNEAPSGGATMTVAEAEAITSDANRLGIIRDGRIHANELIGEILGLVPVLRSAVNNRRAVGTEVTAATVPDPGSRRRAASPSEPTSTPDNRRPPGAGTTTPAPPR